MLSNSHNKEFEDLFRILTVFNTKIDTVIEKLDTIQENTGTGVTIKPEPVIYTVTFTGGTSGVSNCDIYINDTGYDTGEDIIIGMKPDAEITVKFVPHEGYKFEDDLPHIEDTTVSGSTKIIKAELIDNVYTAVYTFKNTCILSLSALPVLEPQTITVNFDATKMVNTNYTVYYNDNMYDNPDSIDVVPGETMTINFTSNNGYHMTSNLIRVRGDSISPISTTDNLISYEYQITDDYTTISFDLYCSSQLKIYIVNFIKDLTCGFEVEYDGTTVNNPDSLTVNHGNDINIKLLTTHNGEFATAPTITYDGNTIGFDIDDINYTKTINITKNLDIGIYTDYIYGAYNPDYPDEDFYPNHADTPNIIYYTDNNINIEPNEEYVINIKHIKNFAMAYIDTNNAIQIKLEYINHNGEEKIETHNYTSGRTYLMETLYLLDLIEDNKPCKIIITNVSNNNVNAAIYMAYTTKLTINLVSIKGGQSTQILGKKYLTVPDNSYNVQTNYIISNHQYTERLYPTELFNATGLTVGISCTSSCQYYYFYTLA